MDKKTELNENKTVSVIMAVYNCADTVSDAIDSILDQTYKDIQFIICNDNSSDNTAAVVQEYADKYPDKIIFISNEANMRLSYSLNHCLEYATGKYIARMDGDDISRPDRFEKQIEFLESHPEFDLVGTAMQRFNDSGLANIDAKPEFPDRFTLRKNVPFNHATIMTYKRVYDAVDGYTVSERTVRGQDYDLWFRFYYQGFNGYNIQEPLYLVREDINAIKRRTVMGRINGFKTTLYGYKLLNYPKHWIIRPAVSLVVKSLIPPKLMLLYRDFQKKYK